MPAVPLRLVIAEDSVLLREGLRQLIVEEGHTVVRAVSNGADLLTEVAKFRPDVAIVDVRMPPSFTDEGIRATIEIRHAYPDVGIMVLSQYVEERYATELLAENTSGVGYLLKDRVADVGDFISAVERVAAGGTALDPEVVSQILTRSRHRDRLAELTTRERDVLTAMAQGHSNTAIARQLVVSEGTIEKHINAIFGKLGLVPGGHNHRRVLAVLTYLAEQAGAQGSN